MRPEPDKREIVISGNVISELHCTTTLKQKDSGFVRHSLSNLIHVVSAQLQTLISLLQNPSTNYIEMVYLKV